MTDNNNNQNTPENQMPPTPQSAEANSHKGGKKEKIKKPKGPKGPIRTEAVVPFLIVVVVTWVYFHFFFDRHLKSALEFAGYQIVGAEVNIASLETSFSNASIRIKKVELTDSEKPTHNVFSIGDIRFGMLWDALLRAKIVVNEMAVEDIILGGKRNHTGKVKPPEPPPVDDGKPSFLEQEAKKLKDKALNETEKKYNDNVMGDIAALLGGANASEQLKKIEGTLASKEMLKKFETDLNAKKTAWDARLKTLPQGKEIQALGDRLSKVKTKDFKTPQELQTSLTEIDKVFKEADAKYKTIKTASDDLNTDLKALDAQFRAVEQQVKDDIKELQARFKIPKIDAASLAQSLLRPYMDPYLAKINHYKALAEKYLPPKFANKITGKASANDPDDVPIQPHPRAKGVVYEFPNKYSYPLFWIKKVSISSKFDSTSANPNEAASKASADQGYKGNISGVITDITSNQKITNRPTVLKIDGDFPSAGMSDLKTEVSLDNRPEDSIVKFLFGIGSYNVDHKVIADNKDVKIAFDNAVGVIKSEGKLVGLKQLDFKLDNTYSKLKFDVSSTNAQIDPILKEIFAGLPDVSINANGEGVLPRIDFDLQSNIGSELQKGFEKQLAKKIEEAKAKLQAYIDEQVGKEKAKVEAELNKLKAQADGEVKKVQTQLETQKKQAEDKITAAKKSGEAQAKKQVQDEIKKKLSGKDGQKTLNDLKKKLGL